MIQIAAIVCILTLLTSEVYSQPKKSQEPQKKIQEYKSNFQFSLFPGISTNGIQSGSFFNKYSFNLFGGLSRGNRILEIGPFSNAAIRSTSGIQLSGLANIVGANAFLNTTVSGEFELRHQDYESNDKGIQFAGFLNYVRNHSSGIQFAGVLNVVGQNVSGVQLSGVGNSAGWAAVGLQIAGLYNIAKRSMAGVQLSSLFNYTDGQLSGTQIGLINKARRITGRNSAPPTRARGLQIGLLNFSKEMKGTQVGLINFGGYARGKQIGLLNFFGVGPTHENVNYGTPVGIWNFRSSHSYLRFYSNELFTLNIDRTTGNCLNCSGTLTDLPLFDDNKTLNQNPLVVGYDPARRTWGFGYGFQKILTNKFSIAPNPRNEKRMLGYGFKLMHLNKTLSFDPSFNLLNRLNFDYGRKWKSAYLYAGISLNYFLFETGETAEDYKIRSVTASTGGLFGFSTAVWPGYELGLHF